jgi:hypothetical protein
MYPYNLAHCLIFIISELLKLIIMKKLQTLTFLFILTGASVFGRSSNNDIKLFEKNYNNSFIFNEQGIEFAIFLDGQFDFNISYGQHYNSVISFSNVNISFNTGYNYDAFVQYDAYGAVIQIENAPIFYDYYGRIVKAGSVKIRYNRHGHVSRIGGLSIYYNSFNTLSHFSGFINTLNRRYVSRPWYSYYSKPLMSLCVVNVKPYRRHYSPVRYRYYSLYQHNLRPKVSHSYFDRNTSIVNTRKRGERYRQNHKASKNTRRFSQKLMQPSSKKTSNSKNTSSSLRNKREYSQSKPSINKGFNHNSKNTSRKSRLNSNETVESKNSTRTKNKKSLASKHSKKKRFKKSRFSTKKTNLKSNFASNSQRNKNRRSKRSREK